MTTQTSMLDPESQRRKRKTRRLWAWNVVAIVGLLAWLLVGLYNERPTLLIGTIPNQSTDMTGVGSTSEASISRSEPHVVNVESLSAQSKDKFSSPFTTTIATIVSTQTIAFIGNADVDQNLYASIPRVTIANLDNLEGQVGTFSVGRYIMLLNFGESISISRWTVFTDDKFFYQIPDFTIEKGQAVRIHIGVGENTKRDLFTNFNNLPTSAKNIKRVTLRDERNAVIDELEILENAPPNPQE